MVLVPSVYLLLILLLTYPLPFDPFSATPGWATVDRNLHIWDFWWALRSLEVGQSIYYSDYVFYPGGVWMWSSNCGPLLSLFSMLPGLIFGDAVAAYNYVVLTSLLFSCLGGYLLGRHLFRDRLSAFFLGTVTAFNPYVLFHVHVGLVEYVNLGFGLLYLLSLFRLLRQPSLRNTVLSCLAYLLAATWAWHMGYLLLLFTALLLPFEIRPAALRALNLRALSRVALWVVVVGSFLTSAYLLMGRGWSEEEMVNNQEQAILADSQVPASQRVFPLRALADPQRRPQAAAGAVGKVLEVKLINSLDPMSIVRDSDDFDGKQFYFLRWLVPLALALIGAVVTRGRRTAFYLLVILSSLLMSLGPCLIFNGSVHLDSYQASPYTLLSWVVPGINRIQFPHRFLIPAVFCLCILSCHGLEIILSRYCRTAARRVGAVVICTGVFLGSSFQLVGYPLLLESIPVPQLYSRLANEPGAFAIIEVPFERGAGCRQKISMGEVPYYQTIHGKRRYSGDIPRYLARRNYPPQIDDNLLLTLLARATTTRKDILPTEVDQARLRQSLHDLQAAGFKYLLVHSGLLRRDNLRAIRRLLDRHLGAATVDRSTEDVILLYSLQPGAS